MSAPWEIRNEHDMWEFIILMIVIGAALYIILAYLWPSIYAAYSHFSFNYNFKIPHVGT